MYNKLIAAIAVVIVLVIAVCIVWTTRHTRRMRGNYEKYLEGVWFLTAKTREKLQLQYMYAIISADKDGKRRVYLVMRASDADSSTTELVARGQSAYFAGDWLQCSAKFDMVDGKPFSEFARIDVNPFESKMRIITRSGELYGEFIKITTYDGVKMAK